MFRHIAKDADISSEGGFTLVEILVVILIIGILASIAIPVFLNQRQVANDATVESDVKNTAVAVETYFVNNKDASTINKTEMATMVKKSAGVIMHFSGDRNDWCVNASHPNSKRYRNWENNPLPGIRPYVLYSSKLGGFVKDDTHVSALSCNNNFITL